MLTVTSSHSVEVGVRLFALESWHSFVAHSPADTLAYPPSDHWPSLTLTYSCTFSLSPIHSCLPPLSPVPYNINLCGQVQYRGLEDHRFSFTGATQKVSSDTHTLTKQIDNVLYEGRKGFRMGGLDTRIGDVTIYEWVIGAWYSCIDSSQIQRGNRVMTHGRAYRGFGKELLFCGAERNPARQITCFFLMAENLNSGEHVACIRVSLTEVERLLDREELIPAEDVEDEVDHNTAMVVKHFYRHLGPLTSIPVWSSFQHHAMRMARSEEVGVLLLIELTQLRTE